MDLRVQNPAEKKTTITIKQVLHGWVNNTTSLFTAVYVGRLRCDRRKLKNECVLRSAFCS